MTAGMADDRAGVRTVARAPGKLVLLGEYAVLEGGPALVAAVDREVIARRISGPSESPVMIALGAQGQSLPLDRTTGAWRTAEPGWTLAAAAIEAAFGPQAPSLEIDSRAFFLPDAKGNWVKAGFGSSAAVVTAILALGREADAAEDADPADVRAALLHTAREVHHSAQGNLGSGVDIAAAVYGGILNYRLVSGEPVCRPHAIPVDVRLLAVWTGAAASTTDLVGRVVKWKASEPAKQRALFERMSVCAAAGIAAGAADAAGFLEVMQAYGALLEELGQHAGAPIVTPPMRELADGLGSRAVVKPSGAGGGDIVLVAARGDREVDVRRRLDQLGATVVPLRFGAPGATLQAGA